MYLFILVFISFSGLYSLIIQIPSDQPTIQEGINIAENGDIVLVDPGHYFENLYICDKNITLASRYYFNAEENYINETVIDANFNGSAISVSGLTEFACIVTGFTIINGESLAGGGIFSEDTNLELHSLIIDNCVASYGISTRGGGIYCINSEVIIENSEIKNCTCINASYSKGGGMYATNSNIVIRNSVFRNNSCEYGGGIDLEYSTSQIINSLFKDNEATEDAGGIAIAEGISIIVNSLLTENFAHEYGGAIGCWAQADVTIINCTFTQNTGNIFGGSLIMNTDATCIIKNSILWGNDPEEIYIDIFSDPTLVEIEYSDISGGLEGIHPINNNDVIWLEGNIDELPHFLNSGGHRFQLNDSSPCIDAGTPDTTSLNLPLFDLMGRFRVWDGDDDEVAVIDMGAYEYSSPLYENLLLTPATLEFYSHNDTDGLTFSLTNPNSYEVIINNITQSGYFGDFGAMWYIEDPMIEFPYSMSSSEQLEFLVWVDFPVREIRDILIDYISIDTEYEQLTVNLLLDSNLFSSSEDNSLILNTELIGNYPNPFNPTTSISFSIPESGKVELSIYNIKGQKVKTLVNEIITAGEHSIIWDGRDSKGKPVSSGIYLYNLKVNNRTEVVRKCLLLK